MGLGCQWDELCGFNGIDLIFSMETDHDSSTMTGEASGNTSSIWCLFSGPGRSSSKDLDNDQPAQRALELKLISFGYSRPASHQAESPCWDVGVERGWRCKACYESIC